MCKANPVISTEKHTKDGTFNRSKSGWRSWVRRGDETFPAAPHRYHLYVAAACPWAHRCWMVRNLKGLEDVIPMTVVHPTWQRTRPESLTDKHAGWVFATTAQEDDHGMTNANGSGGPFPRSVSGCDPDPLFQCKTVRDLYDRAGDVAGLYSVPLLWDTHHGTIVSNESSDIVQMLNSEFNEWAKYPDVDLYPKESQKEIDAMNEYMYEKLNNGVYKCGLSKSQAAYMEAVTELTKAFDFFAHRLATQRYVASPTEMTLADIFLFCTILRFDEVYTVYFKTNSRMVSYTPSLLNWCREIYQHPRIRPTVWMEQIKMHYYTSHPAFNQWSIIPIGNNFEGLLKEPHNRDQLLSNSNNFFKQMASKLLMALSTASLSSSNCTIL